MANKPKQLVISSLKRTSGSTASLEWTIVKASMPLDSYTLYKEAENKKYYKMVGWSTKEPKYEIQGLNPGTEYGFKLVTRNSCGASPTSEAVRINMPAFPSKMQPVKKVKQGCDVKITWKAPTNQDSPVLNYIV